MLYLRADSANYKMNTNMGIIIIIIIIIIITIIIITTTTFTQGTYNYIPKQTLFLRYIVLHLNSIYSLCYT